MKSVTAFGEPLMMVMEAIEEVATANRHIRVKDESRYEEETLLLWFHLAYLGRQRV